jgi:hypothetical protein
VAGRPGGGGRCHRSGIQGKVGLISPK